MKIGKSESIEAVTPADWQRMARGSRLGWPMLRERIVDLCGRRIEALSHQDLLRDDNGPAMTERVACIIQERATSLRQSM